MSETKWPTSNLGTYTEEKFIFSKEALETLYVDKKLSLREIANEHGCSPTCILKKLKKLEIPRRGLSKAGRIARRRYSEEIEHLDYTEIKEEYNPLDQAYIAGFFDADGCPHILIARTNYRFKYRFAPYISFIQNDRNILEWIAKTLNVDERIYRNGNGYKLDIYDYPGLKKTIACMIDHSKIKKLQLELLIETIDTLGNWTGNYRRRLKKDQLLTVLGIAKKLRKLNNSPKICKLDLDEVEKEIRGFVDE